MQPTVVCVAKAAPAVNSLMVCVGPLVDMEDDHPFHGGNGSMKTEKRTRSDSISDHTDSDRMTRQTTKKLRASPEGRPETSVLTDAVWKKMQSMIRATKNLRNITRVTLAFFREHELAQMRMLGLERPVYPIVVPVSEAYNILSFRKRRVYDVLHVLEGVGVLKRIQDKHSEVSRFRGGQFMYFGRDGAKQRLESIYKRAQGISKDTTTLYPDATQRNVDTVLLAACNAQAAVESWPHLAATTVSFLSFVLASDTNDTNSLGLLNRRLVDARIACDGSIPEAGRDGLIAETNRRVYDVVSVLASLNIVILKSLSEELKKESGRRVGYATPRRGVVFNAAIFSDSSLIRVGNSCASHLASALAKEEAKFPAAKNVDESEVTDEASQGSCLGDDAALEPLLLELDVPDMEDLFPGIEPSECTDTSGEWWDVPLRDLLLRDALPPVDFLDWEIMQAISRSRLRSADDKAPFDTSKECDSHLDDEAELECHEQLDAA